jgi:hypothetical protein
MNAYMKDPYKGSHTMSKRNVTSAAASIIALRESGATWLQVAIAYDLKQDKGSRTQERAARRLFEDLTGWDCSTSISGLSFAPDLYVQANCAA